MYIYICIYIYIIYYIYIYIIHIYIYLCLLFITIYLLLIYYLYYDFLYLYWMLHTSFPSQDNKFVLYYIVLYVTCVWHASGLWVTYMRPNISPVTYHVHRWTEGWRWGGGGEGGGICISLSCQAPVTWAAQDNLKLWRDSHGNDGR